MAVGQLALHQLALDIVGSHLEVACERKACAKPESSQGLPRILRVAQHTQGLRWAWGVGQPHLILIFSTNTNCESMAYRSFSLSGFDARGVRKVTICGSFSGCESNCESAHLANG